MKQGWEIKKLGEVCTVIAGQSPEGKFYNIVKKGLPFYQGKKEFTKKYLGAPSKWTSKTTKEALADDILMSVRAPVGPVNFSTQKICIGRGLAAIRPKEKINKDFLFNFLVNHENKITGNTGAVFNSINKAQIEGIEIPIPTLPEQKRIVAILYEAFAAIDKAKANAEKNLANAKELFDSYLNGIFSNPGEDWEEKKLGELFDVKSSKRVHKKDWRNRGIPFYRAREVVKLAEFGKVDNDLFIDPELYREFTKDKGYPKENDIIISAVGTLGKCYLVKKVDKFYIKDASVLWFDKISDVDSRYIDYSFKSDFILRQVMYKSMGATVGTLTITRAKNIQIPIPILIKQKQIVEKLDKLQFETKSLEVIYQQKTDDLEELKKSILQKVFEGEF